MCVRRLVSSGGGCRGLPGGGIRYGIWDTVNFVVATLRPRIFALNFYIWENPLEQIL